MWKVRGTAAKHPRVSDRRNQAERAMRAAMTPGLQGELGAAIDDVHSFVLRVNLNRSQSGQGPARPQYQLEYVNGCTSRRFKSLDEVLGQIRVQVTEIFEALGFSETA